MELNPANVTLAREFADKHGLANVDMVQGDARRTGLPSSSFDLVHARTLLIKHSRSGRGGSRDGAAGQARRLGRGAGT
jgi:hypothetical protein